MIDLFWLQILVSIDIVLSILFRFFDSEKKQPLSSMEFHFFMTDFIGNLNDIINEDSKQRRQELLDSELRTYDRIKRGTQAPPEERK